ncbi:MAG: hypothetical protein Q9222_001010 [Ikaeria aurantiellina]
MERPYSSSAHPLALFLQLLQPFPWFFDVPKGQLKPLELRCRPDVVKERQDDIFQLRCIPLFQFRDTPIRSVYRLYEYMCAGFHTQVQYETEYFFFHHDPDRWTPDNMHDLEDEDEERYAFVASILEALIAAFNWRLSMGLQRDHSRLTFSDMDANPPKLFRAPGWAIAVPPLPAPLVLAEDVDQRKTPFIDRNIYGANNGHIMELDDPTLQREFNWSSFSLALSRLDFLVAESAVLEQHAPICIVASGGFVSLWYLIVIDASVATEQLNSAAYSALGNRMTTQDLNYFIDPVVFGSMYGQVQNELRRLISQVAQDMHLVKGWANDEVSLFLTLLRDPKDLFDRSIQQGLLLYSGTNLRIYGVLWLWVLVRKMKRLQMEGQPPREVDWSDCVCIAQRMVEETGETVTKRQLKEFDHTDREPPVFDATIYRVNQRFQAAFGFSGFSD